MKFPITLNFNPTSAQFILLSSLFIAAIFNAPFLSAVYEVVAPVTLNEWVFFLSVPLLLTFFNVIFLSLFGALFLPRTTVAIAFVVSSLLLYGTLAYGVIFDKSMIQNVMETNSGEAFSYLNSTLFLFFSILGLIPVFAIFNLEINGKLKARIKHLLVLNLLALLGIAIIATFLFKSYAAVGRNNKDLTKYIIPYAFYDSGYKYLRDTYFYPPLPYKVLDKRPYIKGNANIHPSITVLVVGETARADKFSSNSYSRRTSPNIQNAGAISFSKVTSCGTATAVSVPCMFSRLSRENYDSRIADSQDNVLDIIHRAGVDVTWIDNNSSCKGVCKRVETIDFNPSRDPKLCDGDYCYDEVLVDLLRETLSRPSKEHRVIVLHMIGSHGPTYYRRYPEKFAKFVPDCPRSDIQNCEEAELTNTYDNTIAYTDYVLGQIIEQLATIPNSSMLYLSDHGESLGENGLYLHGFPYNLAPVEQTHVPMVYWASRFSQPQYSDCVNSLSSHPYSQDNLFDTLLGLTNVQSSTYQPTQDILRKCES